MGQKRKRQIKQGSPLAYKAVKYAQQAGNVYTMAKGGYNTANKIYQQGKAGYKVVKNQAHRYFGSRLSGGRKLIQNGRTGYHTGTMAKERGTVVLNKAVKGKTAGKWKYSQSSETIIGVEAGVQRPHVINIIGSKSSLFTSSGVTYGIGQNHTALNELNPYLKITGSSLLTAGTKPSADKFIIKSVRSRMEITNTSATGVTVSVAWYLHKLSNTSNVVDQWEANLQDSNPTTLTSTAYPVPAATDATAGFPTILIPGQNPMTCRAFRAGFKKVFGQEFQMASASVKVCGAGSAGLILEYQC